MKNWEKNKLSGLILRNWQLLSILVLAGCLRFFRLSELFHWTLDEEYWSYIPFNIASGYHFPLIGGHISGTGLYSGPLFVWIMGFVFWIFSGHPLAVAALVSALGIVSVLVLYFLGQEMFGKRVGLIASLLAAASFLWVLYDRKYWNASPIIILSLLIIMSIFKIYKGKSGWLYVLSLSLAVAFHAHMTSAALFIFAAAALAMLKKLKKRSLIRSLGLFLLLQVPLFLFELRHDFLNSKALISLLSRPGNNQSPIMALGQVSQLFTNTFARLIYAPLNLDISRELTLCTQYADYRFQPQALAIAIAVASLFYLISHFSQDRFRILILLLASNFLGLVFYKLIAGPGNWYPGQLSEYFFLPSFPVLILSVSFLLDRLMQNNKILGAAALAALLALNISAIITAEHSDGFARKLKIVQQITQEVRNKNFALDVKSPDPCRLYGYRYLFTFFGKEPSASYLDPQFKFLYEGRLPQGEAEVEVTIVSQGGKIGYEIKDK